MNKKYVVISIICTILSIVAGILSDDLIIGGAILLTGLLCAYFASKGKRINYILGLINYVLMGYVSLKNKIVVKCTLPEDNKNNLFSYKLYLSTE